MSVCTEISFAIDEAIGAIAQLKQAAAQQFFYDVSRLMAAVFQQGGKVLIAGNGGSCCDGQHFAEELTGFFRKKRQALPAIALADAGHITCVANDLNFESVFSRGVEAHGRKGDLFFGLSTSGNSENVINAVFEAKSRGLHTVALLGRDGGRLTGEADYELLISGNLNSDRIQEAHMTALHLLVELVEALLFC